MKLYAIRQLVWNPAEYERFTADEHHEALELVLCVGCNPDLRRLPSAIAEDEGAAHAVLRHIIAEYLTGNSTPEMTRRIAPALQYRIETRTITGGVIADRPDSRPNSGLTAFPVIVTTTTTTTNGA
jgi:hypothetical protein